MRPRFKFSPVLVRLAGAGGGGGLLQPVLCCRFTLRGPVPARSRPQVGLERARFKQ